MSNTSDDTHGQPEATDSTITVEVCLATSGAFLPFTPVPKSWAGKQVRLLVEDIPSPGEYASVDAR